MDAWLALEDETSNEESDDTTDVENSDNEFVHKSFELF